MVDLEDTFSLQAAFLQAFADRGVAVRYGCRGRRLLTEAGRVLGIVADTPSGSVAFHSGSGVVLATGGYQAGPDVRRRYQPEHLAATPYLGVPTCRGDGHRMGQAVGGDLLNMTMVQPLVIVGSALVEDSIAVNLEGRRFHDEAGPYDDRVAALVQQPRRAAFYVFDGPTDDHRRHLVDQMPARAVSASTLAELAALIGVPEAELALTVAAWNELVQSGSSRDPVHGRVVFPGDRSGIVEGPFWASPMVLGVNFPAGGFRTSDSMAVVDVFGEVVPGLFAAGDTAGGVNPCLGLGGIHISSAFTLGFVAGRSVATGDVGTVNALPHLDEPPPPRGTVRMALVDLPAGIEPES